MSGAVIYQFPACGPRVEALAAAPADALGLLEAAAARLGDLAGLISAAAPGPEVTAAAEAVKALRGPLASLQITAEALVAARRMGEADARDALAALPPRRRPLPGGSRTPGGAA